MSSRYVRSIQIFFAYSHKDERRKIRLESHLSMLRRQDGVKLNWHKHQIQAAREQYSKIYEDLKTAHLIVLLISPDFLYSDDYWHVEIKLAMKRHEDENVPIIPVILCPTDNWQSAFSNLDLEALPRDGRAVTTWPNRDQAFEDVARGIRVVAEYQQKLQEYKHYFYFSATQQGYPLSADACRTLQQLKNEWGIRERDAVISETKISREIKAQNDQRRQRLIQQQRIQRACVVAVSCCAIIVMLGYWFVSLNTKSPEEFFEQGLAESNGKNWAQAIEDYNKAIQGDPTKAIYYTKRGNAYYGEKNLQKAIEDYNKAIHMDYTNAEAYVYRSEILSNLGNRQAAIKDLQQAAYIYKKQGKKNDYQKTLKKLKKLQR